MVVLGITTIISYGTTQYLFGVLVVPLDATFHWGRASISGAYTLGLIIAGLLGVPFGYLVDRRGARLLMSSGSALAGLALIGLARVNALWQFYLLWSVGLGLAMALTLYPVTFTIVANWFVRKRGKALAILTLHLRSLESPRKAFLLEWGGREYVDSLRCVMYTYLHGVCARTTYRTPHRVPHHLVSQAKAEGAHRKSG